LKLLRMNFIFNYLMFPSLFEKFCFQVSTCCMGMGYEWGDVKAYVDFTFYNHSIIGWTFELLLLIIDLWIINLCLFLWFLLLSICLVLPNEIRQWCCYVYSVALDRLTISIENELELSRHCSWATCKIVT